MNTIEKFIITNNFSKVYNTREEAQKAYDEELKSIKDPIARGAFQFFHHVAPYYINNK